MSRSLVLEEMNHFTLTPVLLFCALVDYNDLFFCLFGFNAGQKYFFAALENLIL